MEYSTREKIDEQTDCILYLSADWCLPCKMISPIMEELSKEFNILKVNVDTEKDIASNNGVKSIPQLLFFKNKSLIGKFGPSSRPKDVIKQAIVDTYNSEF